MVNITALRSVLCELFLELVMTPLGHKLVIYLDAGFVCEPDMPLFGQSQNVLCIRCGRCRFARLARHFGIGRKVVRRARRGVVW